MQRNHPACMSAVGGGARTSSLSSSSASSASSTCSSSAGSPPPPSAHRHRRGADDDDHRPSRRESHSAAAEAVVVSTCTSKPAVKRPFDIESLIGPDRTPSIEPLDVAATPDCNSDADDDILRRFPSIAHPAAYPVTAAATTPLMMPYGLHHAAAAAAAAIAFQDQHRHHQHQLQQQHHLQHHHAQLQQLQLHQHQQHYLRYAAAASYFPHNWVCICMRKYVHIAVSALSVATGEGGRVDVPCNHIPCSRLVYDNIIYTQLYRWSRGRNLPVNNLGLL